MVYGEESYGSEVDEEEEGSFSDDRSDSDLSGSESDESEESVGGPIALRGPAPKAHKPLVDDEVIVLDSDSDDGSVHGPAQPAQHRDQPMTEDDLYMDEQPFDPRGYDPRGYETLGGDSYAPDYYQGSGYDTFQPSLDDQYAEGYYYDDLGEDDYGGEYADTYRPGYDDEGYDRRYEREEQPRSQQQQPKKVVEEVIILDSDDEDEIVAKPTLPNEMSTPVPASRSRPFTPKANELNASVFRDARPRHIPKDSPSSIEARMNERAKLRASDPSLDIWETVAKSTPVKKEPEGSVMNRSVYGAESELGGESVFRVEDWARGGVGATPSGGWKVRSRRKAVCFVLVVDFVLGGMIY